MTTGLRYSDWSEPPPKPLFEQRIAMVASRSNTTTSARIPALGARFLLLIFMSIVLMVLDHRQHHLDSVRRAISAAVYPLQVVVDAPFRLWAWLREETTERAELRLEVGRLQAERLLTNARLQRMNALEAENARLKRAVADLTIDKLILKEVVEGKY